MSVSGIFDFVYDKPDINLVYNGLYIRPQYYYLGIGGDYSSYLKLSKKLGPKELTEWN